MSRRPPIKLQRRRARRDPKKRFTVLCEGGNTEPYYFAALRSLYKNSLISIETVNGVGVPWTVAKQAVSYARQVKRERKRRDTESYEEGDEIWVAFDRDDHPRFHEAVQLCENNGVSVARSNPCFEVWIILHIEDFNKPDDRRSVFNHLQRLCSEYDPKGGKTLNFRQLLGGLEEAECRADVLLRRREEEGNPYGRPSTTVGLLSRTIREAANRFT